MSKSSKKKTRLASPTVTYWHGGAGGRSVGDDLLPGTHIPGYQDFLAAQSSQFHKDYAPEFVYITTNRDLAFDFAVDHAKWGLDTAVYRVAPRGKPSRDPDFPAGVAFRCRVARVLEIETDGINSSMEETGTALSYCSWDDGSPLYDTHLLALPSKAMQHFGVTSLDFKKLGRAASFQTVMRYGSEILKQRNPGITQAEMNEVLVATGSRPHLDRVTPRR